MFEVNIFSAVLAGLLTFLAPCTFPLIPGYIAFLGGVATDEKKNKINYRLLNHALMFVLGFSVVFILFGMISGAIGAFLGQYRFLLSRVGGLLVILFGLSMLHVIPFPQISLMRGKMPSFVSHGNLTSSFLLGFLFALGWSPCLGPVLGTILVLASASGSIFHGGFLLLLFALGLGIPFLLIALLFEKVQVRFERFNTFLPHFSVFGGVFFICIGILLVFGNLGLLTELGSYLLPTQWYERIMDYL